MGFNDVLNRFFLFDMGFVAFPFTWCKKLSNGNCILERLDRIVSNVE